MSTRNGRRKANGAQIKNETHLRAAITIKLPEEDGWRTLTPDSWIYWMRQGSMKESCDMYVRARIPKCMRCRGAPPGTAKLRAGAARGSESIGANLSRYPRRTCVPMCLTPRSCVLVLLT